MDPAQNLLGEPAATHLPEDPAARELLDGGTDPREIARAHPTYSLAWALLSERAFEAGEEVEAYAYARVGYHRGLDALRRNGWKGHGPVPWGHEPNRGFLRSLAMLSRAAEAIEETDEAVRCATFLADSSRAAADELLHR